MSLSLQASSAVKATFPPCSAQLGSSRASFYVGPQTLQGVQRRAPRVVRKQLEVTNFKFLKNLGLKKPGFLPDFGKVPRDLAWLVLRSGCFKLQGNQEPFERAGEKAGSPQPVLYVSRQVYLR